MTTVRAIAEKLHAHIQGLPLAHAMRLTARVRDTVQAVTHESRLTDDALRDECVRHVSAVILDELPSISRPVVAQLAPVMVGMVSAAADQAQPGAAAATRIGGAKVTGLRSPESDDGDGDQGSAVYSTEPRP